MAPNAKLPVWGILLGISLWLSVPALGQGTPSTIDNFALADADGQLVELQDFTDQSAVVVIFTSSNCSWAHSYHERIVQLHEDFASHSVAFIGINSNDPSLSLRDESSRMRTHTPFAFDYLKDSSQAVARQFGATKNPEVFVLVPRNSTFRVVYQGRIDDNPLDQNMVQEHLVRDALEAVLAGRLPQCRSTPPQGCRIRWDDTLER